MMRRFNFPLETLLQSNQAAEDAAQRDLAKVLRHRMILESQIRRQQTTISTSKHQLASGLRGRIDLDMVRQFAHYSGQATQRAHQMVISLASVQEQIQKAQARLAVARRRRRAIELVRQRRFEAFKRKEHRREVCELDEVAREAYRRQSLGAV